MSGQQIGTVVGGVIGAIWGYPQLGAAIGGYIGGVIDPTVIKGPSIGDAQSQTSQGGMPIPKVLGHGPPIAPTLIDGDKLARKIKIRSGGKGDTTQTEQEGWRATRAFLVCEGEVLIARITRNGKLVYSAIEGDNLDADSAKFASQITIYTGSETQGPDPSLEAIHGVGNTPYYRGRCYFVVRDDDETQTGGAANQYRIEVIGSGGTTTSTCEEDGLIAWWPLDDAVAGGSARELIAGKDGVYSAGVAAGPALRVGSGGSAFFSDFGQYMVVTGNPVTSAASMSHWTVSCWGRPIAKDGTNQGGDAAKQMVCYSDGDFFSGSVDWALRFRGPSSGANKNLTPNGVTYLVGGSSDTDLSDSGPVTLGQTVFMAMTWATNPTGSNGTLSFYVNGVLVDQAVDVARSPISGADIVVGGGFEYPTSYQFIGYAENVKVYNVTLTPDEIAAKYLDPQNYFDLPDIAGAYTDQLGNVNGICAPRVSALSVQWKDIVAEIARRASPLLPAHLDIDNMTDEVPGFVLGNATLTGSEYVRTLCTFYTVDLPEYDDQIHAIRRGGAVVATLDPDDLLAVEDEDNDVRSPALRTFQRLTVMYPDPANKYVPTPQTAPRTSPDVTTSNQVTVQCPIPFDAATMAQKADILQKIAFLQVEGTFKRSFPAEYSKYVASDAIMFNDRRHIITKASNDDGMVTFECAYDRPSAYTSTAAGTSAPPPEPPSSSIKGPSILAAVNLPSLRSSDNVPGIYLGVGAILDGWAGADIYVSFDGGVTESLELTIMDEATMGSLAATCDSGATDLITASILHGRDLNSVTDAQIAARANAFAIVTSGVAEIGQVKTATETVTAGTYDLTDLTRGELGTTAAAHAAGDRFVLLDSAIKFLPIDESYAGQTLILRAVSRGTAAALNPTVSLVFDPGDIIIDGGGDPL